MKLLLVRHAERQHDQPEHEAALTPNGITKASATAAEVAEEHRFDVVFASRQNPTLATAEMLPREPGSHVTPLEVLDPGSELKEYTRARKFSRLPELLPSLHLSNESAVAIVGHHPGITNILRSVIGRDDCRRIGPGEAILVEGTFEEFNQSAAYVTKVYGTPDTSEKLRQKVELKMTVCALLAGFTIPALVELLKGPPKEMLEAWRIFSSVAFTFSLAFFVAGILAFDLLLMPSDFWGPLDNLRPEPKRTDKFAVSYKLNGPIYAYMQRTWAIFFNWGV